MGSKLPTKRFVLKLKNREHERRKGDKLLCDVILEEFQTSVIDGPNERAWLQREAKCSKEKRFAAKCVLVRTERSIETTGAFIFRSPGRRRIRWCFPRAKVLAFARYLPCSLLYPFFFLSLYLLLSITLFNQVIDLIVLFKSSVSLGNKNITSVFNISIYFLMSMCRVFNSTILYMNFSHEYLPALIIIVMTKSHFIYLLLK